MNPLWEKSRLPRSIKRNARALLGPRADILLIGSALMLAIMSAFISCGSPEAAESDPTPVVQSNLGLLEGNKGCAVRLYGISTFNAFDQNFSWPTEFKLPPIPITWMGPIFTGHLETEGAGAAIYDVHGGASEDGNWIETMYYSVNTFRPQQQTGVYFRITLRNIPLKAGSSQGASWKGIFEITGSDVQKYVGKIEFSGPNKYLSTDWKTQASGQEPNLKVEFLEEAPAMETAPQISGGGGM
jgi:hypothetical protein